MKFKEKLIYILLIFLVAYYILANSIVFASTRTTDLEPLNQAKYSGILPLIQDLQKAHPKWTFTILYTGLDWDDVIANETSGRKSLIQSTDPAWIAPSAINDTDSWRVASVAAVSYYIDIRNWVNEDNIFAFEALSYDENTQKIEGVKQILTSKFKNLDTIAQIIMDVAKGEKCRTSPYHLASRIRQEQGNGNTKLTSGDFIYIDANGKEQKDLMGYYNFFNIGAGGEGEEAVINGLTSAREKGWTSPELAIKGGAEILAKNYIRSTQDTLYLQKYNVDNSNGKVYVNQYMQNIGAPFSEGRNTRKAYNNLGMLNSSFNFIIPVYENMLTLPCPKPSTVIVTENVEVTTQDGKLRLREGPSTNTSKVVEIPKGTVVLRIEKATAKSNDGRLWDKIVYNNGSEIKMGYAVRINNNGAKYLTDIEDIITVNEPQITNTGVNLRNGPGLHGTTIKKTVPINTKLTVIDKMTFPVDDYVWYRVKLKDSEQGYMASKYLGDKEVELEKYRIEDEKIIAVPGIKLENITGATTTSEVLGTGAKILIEDKEYIVIMLGDANGDGVINSGDLLKIQKHLLKVSLLNNTPYEKSADANRDGVINSGDLLKVQKYLLHVSDITL